MIYHMDWRTGTHLIIIVVGLTSHVKRRRLCFIFRIDVNAAFDEQFNDIGIGEHSLLKCN